MHRVPLCVAVTIALVLGGAASAQATTVTFKQACPKSLCVPELTITGAAGERNNLLLSEIDGKRWRVVEAGGYPLTGPTDVCTALGPSELSCVKAELRIDAGDQDDTVVVTADALGAANIRGGSGNDVLQSAAESTLDGGPGNDVLRGGGHADRLVLSGGLDTLDGAGGEDTLTFYDPADDAGPVAIDLNLGTAVSRAGITTLTGIEDVSTFGGTASIIGTDGPNQITMDRGIADGRGGNDRIQGNGILFGGNGDDELIGTRVAGPTARCGDGKDVVRPLNGPSRMRIDPDCEVLIPGTTGLAARGIAIRPTPVVTAHQIRFRVACTASGGCSGTLKVPALGANATVDFKVAKNKEKRVSVPRPASAPIGQIVDASRRAEFTFSGRARGSNVRATWWAKLLSAKDGKPLR